MWNHWTVRTCYPHSPFQQFELALWTWSKLKNLFPLAASAVLMPNHLHLILPAGDHRSKIEGILAPVSKHSKIHKLWQPIPPPTLIPDRHHLKRQIRYVALNPCRARLCKDPLEWYWSTYRDIMGATAYPWTISTQLAELFRDNERNFKVRIHAYVSGDPSVAVEGTPAPLTASSKLIPEESIITILEAAAASLKLPVSDVRRKTLLRPMFIHLAKRQGWSDTRVIAKLCNTTPRAVQYALNQKIPHGLNAAALCLGDKRLQRHPDY